MGQHHEDEGEPCEKGQVEREKIGVVEDQNRHSDDATHDDVNDVHHQRRDGALHQDGLVEIVCVLGSEPLRLKTGELLGQRKRNPREDPSLEDLDGIKL